MDLTSNRRIPLTKATSRLTIKVRGSDTPTSGLLAAVEVPKEHPFYRAKFIQRKKVHYAACYDIQVKLKGMGYYEGEAMK